MKINVIKSVFALVAVAAVGFGSYKVYDTFTTHQNESDMLLVENVEALSEGDATSSIHKHQSMANGPCSYTIYDVHYKLKVDGGKRETSGSIVGYNGEYFTGASLTTKTRLPKGAYEVTTSNTRTVKLSNFFWNACVNIPLSDRILGYDSDCDWCLQYMCKYQGDKQNWCNTKLDPPTW